MTKYRRIMVLESYHAQRNLAMSATFTAPAPAVMKLKVNGQPDSVETELEDAGNRRDIADVTLVPRDFTHRGFSGLSRQAYPGLPEHDHSKCDNALNALPLGQSGNISIFVITSLTNFASVSPVLQNVAL